MEKFKKNNPIDIIEALCRMGNTEGVGKFEMPCDDKSEQMEQIRCKFIPDAPGYYSWEIVKNEGQIIKDNGKASYPEIGVEYMPGFYLYSYNEELPTDIIDAYTMKIVIKHITPRFRKVYEEVIYLYYMGY